MKAWFSLLCVVTSAVWPGLVCNCEARVQKSIADLLRENGYREDFAGAAYLNKFAVAFRIINNVVCGRCNVTAKEESCLPKLRKDDNSCDHEDLYYHRNIEHKLDKYLPCLMKTSDEITIQCLMETPVGAPKPQEATDGDRDNTEVGVGGETRFPPKDNEYQGASMRDGEEKSMVPKRRKAHVDIVSHAKITRVIIGDTSGDTKDSPLWRRELITSEVVSHVQDPSESEAANRGE